MRNWHTGKRVHCLDLLQVTSRPGSAGSFCDCAILLEIWDCGGLLQTNSAVSPGTEISVPSIGDGLAATVVSCQRDEFGFLVEISVQDPRWFPNGYIPPHLLEQTEP
jgi:hypothetical protein